MDLIKTIEDGEEIDYGSDSSRDDEEQDEVQAPKNSAKYKRANMTKSRDFDESFNFVSNQKEYMKDTWSDISAYVRKKARTTLVDKIAQVRDERLRTKTNGGGDGLGKCDSSDDDSCEKENEGGEGQEGDDDEEEEEEEEEWDDLKTKKSDAKKKAKKAGSDGDEQNSKMVRIEESKGTEDQASSEYFDYDESATFQSMSLSRPLLKAIDGLNWGHPTPIQAATIPTALAGRDICGCAATGTGKTAAYMLPVLERLLYRSQSDSVTRVLVTVPTRELGVQVFQVCKQLAQFTSVDVALSVGGLDLRIQEAELRRSPDVVIATPGRLVDHIKNTPTFSLGSVEVLILDEADRLLDECFLDQMKEIVRSCSPTRQTLLFSATMTDRVNELALVSLRAPVKIFVDSNRAVAWNLQQEFVRIRPAQEERQEAVLAALLVRTFTERVIVFIRTKQQCRRLHIVLGLLGIRAGQLHGNMSQAQRLDSLKQFKEEQIDVLLTTDVAARGLDISGVKTVINFQLPNTLEQYIHRVGRTARAGRFGRSVTFATEQQRKLVKDIVKSARKAVKSRVVPAKVVEKYAGKIASLEADVVRVVEEERAEREIAMLENRTNRMQKELKDGAQERAWIDKRRKAKKDGQQKKAAVGKKERLKRKLGDPQQRVANNEVAYIARSAKRAKRPQKMRRIVENDASKPGKGGRRRAK